MELLCTLLAVLTHPDGDNPGALSQSQSQSRNAGVCDAETGSGFGAGSGVGADSMDSASAAVAVERRLVSSSFESSAAVRSLLSERVDIGVEVSAASEMLPELATSVLNVPGIGIGPDVHFCLFLLRANGGRVATHR